MCPPGATCCAPPGERAWSYIKRAGTVILASTVVLWFLQGFGFTDGGFGMVEDTNTSLLAAIAGVVAPIFAPLGFGTWRATTAAVTGLIAKENVVATLGVLYGLAEVSEEGEEIWANIAADYTALSAYSFMIFNLLCAPCFAAMGAIKREMNNPRWTAFAIGYMCVFAYVVSLIVYQLGGLITGEVAIQSLHHRGGGAAGCPAVPAAAQEPLRVQRRRAPEPQGRRQRLISPIRDLCRSAPVQNAGVLSGSPCTLQGGLPLCWSF